MSWLGLDIGERRIGVAISDPDGIFAQPLTTLTVNSDDPAEEVVELARARGVTGVVVGLPRHMSGRIGTSAERARRFAEILEERLDVPVEFWDERLSTVEADRRLVEAGMSRRRRKEVVDRVAAALILQGWLDRRDADRERAAGGDEESEVGGPGDADGDD